VTRLSEQAKALDNVVAQTLEMIKRMDDSIKSENQFAVISSVGFSKATLHLLDPEKLDLIPCTSTKINANIPIQSGKEFISNLGSVSTLGIEWAFNEISRRSKEAVES